MNGLDEVIYNLALGIPGLLIAVVFHEVAHGLVALKFGDPTAKMAGRLTLNPVAHLDLMGSVFVPILGAVLGGIMFGWAKPVPIDSRYFKNIRSGIFWVSFAGPLANFILVVISALIFAIIYTQVSSDFYLYTPLLLIFKQSVYINTILGAFNLIPLPPLDGSKMLSARLSIEGQRKFDEIGRYGFFILLFLIFTGATRVIFQPALLFANFALNGCIQLFQ